MEKVRAWCGQPSDRGRLKNRTEQKWMSIDGLVALMSLVRLQCKGAFTSLLMNCTEMN